MRINELNLKIGDTYENIRVTGIDDKPEVIKRRQERALKNAPRDKKRQENRARDAELAKRGIIRNSEGKLQYPYCDEMYYLYQLAEIHGIPTDTISKRIREGMSVDDALKIGDEFGCDIINAAYDCELDLKTLQSLVRGGLSLDDAIEQMETDAVERLARVFESTPTGLPAGISAPISILSNTPAL
ncbi:MAG: hypothetical protein ACK5MU_03865 [Candidatus Saccharimonadales bacterium]